MDPVSVVSLVASVGSLATKCTSIVKTLHSLAEAYKSAELSILSIIEECETIRLAWKRIEEWAKENLHHSDGYEDVRERLQRSIYSGDLIMSALEVDLAKAVPKSGTFRRRASVVWNTSTFQEHQGRIRGQVAALQLLLQVISMPQAKDRVEVFSLKEHVFKEVDESVLSIIPSHLSSRFSMTDTDRSSVRSKSSIALRYIPLSFENDLFSSYVYKRNYRLPFRIKLPPSGYAASVRSITTERVIDRTNFERLRKPSEWSFATVRKEKAPALSKWIPILFLEEGTDILHSDHPNHSLNKTLVEHVLASLSREALKCLHDGADICSLFHQRAAVGSHLVPFFTDAFLQEPDFTVTLLERIALAAGNVWMTGLRTFLVRNPPVNLLLSEAWKSAKRAAAWFDEACRIFSQVPNRPSVLQLACASNNFRVTSYLLRTGFRPVSGKEYLHPLILTESRDMRSLLVTQLEIPTNLLDRALWSLLADGPPDHVYWSDGIFQLLLSFEKAFQKFLESGANPNAEVEYYSMRMPLIHGLVYASCEHGALQKSGTKLVEILIDKGLDMNAMATCGQQRIKLSPMHLAARLGRYDLAATLLLGGGTGEKIVRLSSIEWEPIRSKVEDTAARYLTGLVARQMFKIARDDVDRLTFAITYILVFTRRQNRYSFTTESYSLELDELSAYFQEAGHTNEEGPVADSDTHIKEREQCSYVTRQADRYVLRHDLEDCMSILGEPRDPNLRLSSADNASEDSIRTLRDANSSGFVLLLQRVTSIAMEKLALGYNHTFADCWTMGCLLWRIVSLALTGIDIFRSKMYAMDRCYTAFEFAVISDNCGVVDSMLAKAPLATHSDQSRLVTLAALNHCHSMVLALLPHVSVIIDKNIGGPTKEETIRVLDYLALSILSEATHWAPGALYCSHWEPKPEAVLQIMSALLFHPRLERNVYLHQRYPFERNAVHFSMLKQQVKVVLSILPQNATNYPKEHVGKEISAAELAYHALSRNHRTIRDLASRSVKVIWPTS